MYLTKQQARLVLLRHAQHCDGCSRRHCASTKIVLAHISTCTTPCSKTFCATSRMLLEHARQCMDVCCTLCLPWKPEDRCPIPLCTCIPKKRAKHAPKKRATQDETEPKKRATQDETEPKKRALTQDETSAAEALATLIS